MLASGAAATCSPPRSRPRRWPVARTTCAMRACRPGWPPAWPRARSPRWAGHSVAVLLRVYAHALDGQEEASPAAASPRRWVLLNHPSTTAQPQKAVDGWFPSDMAGHKEKASDPHRCWSEAVWAGGGRSRIRTSVAFATDLQTDDRTPLTCTDAIPDRTSPRIPHRFPTTPIDSRTGLAGRPWSGHDCRICATARQRRRSGAAYGRPAIDSQRARGDLPVPGVGLVDVPALSRRTA